MLIGDVRSVLPRLIEAGVRVNCVVTSPPYFNLREYGTDSWEGGNEEACDHMMSTKNKSFNERYFGEGAGSGQRKQETEGKRPVKGNVCPRCGAHRKQMWSGGDPACDHKASNPRSDHSHDKTLDSRGEQGSSASSQKPQPKTCRKCGAERIDQQIGLENSIDEYVRVMVEVFAMVREILADDGTLWLNLGDSYAGGGCGARDPERWPKQSRNDHMPIHQKKNTGLRAKNKCLIPHRVAIALQDDGWIVRQDIVWCLNQATTVYARTKASGIIVATLKDIARLDAKTVELWNGKRWTQLLGMSRHRDTGIEITLRSGERIVCTRGHRWPTKRGLLRGSQLLVGDHLTRRTLAPPQNPRDCAIDADAAWFAGAYLANGSMAKETIQIAAHRKHHHRWEQVRRIAAKFGGYATRTIDGDKQSIRVYGKVLRGILAELVSGRIASDKHIAPVVWRYSNAFLKSYMDGYLEGDGHLDEKNRRERIGFTRNRLLEQDMRTACARLGWTLTLNDATSRNTTTGKWHLSHKGEIRRSRSGHHSEKSREEIVAINKWRMTTFYEVGVADAPNTFALSSGVLTHNSKGNAMPESVDDRPACSHEYLFLCAKSPRYFSDFAAIREPQTGNTKSRGRKARLMATPKAAGVEMGHGIRSNESFQAAISKEDAPSDGMRHPRSVWTINSKANHEAHFATFPPELPKRCILAGSRPGDTVLDPFAGAGTTLIEAQTLGRNWIGIELVPEYASIIQRLTKTQIGFAL